MNRAFGLGLIPATLSALVMASLALLAPADSWHGVDSRWIIGAVLFVLVFFTGLAVGFMVLAMEWRASTAAIVGAALGGIFAYVLGVRSPLGQDSRWNALLAVSLVVVFPSCALLARRLRFRRT
jgi:uncharacterized membrane protein